MKQKHFLKKVLPLSLVILLIGCSHYTLEQKVGQMIITIPPLDSDNVTLNELFNKYYVSGFIYMNWPNDIKGMNKEEIISYTNLLQNQSNISLFIAMDVEGDDLNRIPKLHYIKTNQQYGLKYESAKNKTLFLEDYRKDIKNLTRVLSELGINLNFAPVLDVEKTLKKGIFSRYERSYSTNHETVSALGEVYVSEMENNGTFSTVKHFPGHGHTTCDTYFKICGVNLSKEEYRNIDLMPFIKTLKQNPSFVMVGLFTTPFDEENISILSKTIVSDLLQHELDYQGIIITDDFMMGAIKNMDRYNLTINSLKAGVDMILTTNANDVPSIHQSIISAVENGTLTKKRIDKSFKKIMKLKEKLNGGKIKEN